MRGCFQKYNNACFDALQVFPFDMQGQGVLRAVQVTTASTHDIRLEYFVDALLCLEEFIEIKAVDFVVVVPAGSRKPTFTFDNYDPHDALKKLGWTKNNIRVRKLLRPDQMREKGFV